MNAAAVRVLVVDDQPNIVDMLATVLRFHGFDVVTATTAAEALRRAGESHPRLVVLDVLLPDGDGFEVCRSLRAAGHEIGIVFLTARDAPRDRIAGLTYGGDDYVTKPFSVEELVARVRAVLRRIGSAPVPATGVLRYADLELDEETCEVRRGGRLLSLSPTEFKLLRHLMLNPGRVLSRAQILDAVWRYDFDGASNVVDTYIGYLRRKLDPLGPPLIETRRGFGYALRAPG
ncbi:response regulator transcription factor [Micromonospora carbonacea]|jgi:two-component system OmpR family response regulator|uniref:Response regulator transcription factor n=1 Tax=Micromonospora carbonacea TaxID=47853 RepID=A0A1C4ZVC0_9ACTN|nr:MULTISPECIES: response regulator transcription factor [Micromonospora]MBB5826519.1 two-component system OmpR family response regulator [Micromonospora carbonacea]MDG4819529.1 response regulator transcription factor [Micromonospora sp. WMMD956]QLD26031.1 response regulator transcription factor [Micromonospora carbonacea]WFE55975.1 response regulator transcription factor [Micromonospora sp. WMMD712]SCF36893.1 two-component system, OmpR family, response regulator [Micromonospora carbonacea]